MWALEVWTYVFLLAQQALWQSHLSFLQHFLLFQWHKVSTHIQTVSRALCSTAQLSKSAAAKPLSTLLTRQVQEWRCGLFRKPTAKCHACRSSDLQFILSVSVKKAAEQASIRWRCFCDAQILISNAKPSTVETHSFLGLRWIWNPGGWWKSMRWHISDPEMHVCASLQVCVCACMHVRLCMCDTHTNQIMSAKHVFGQLRLALVLLLCGRYLSMSLQGEAR